MTYAQARQNHHKTPVPRGIGRIVGAACGEGATPSLSTNRRTPRACCLSCRKQDSVCSEPWDRDTSGRASAGPSLSRWTGCESRALHQSFTPKAQMTWDTYYEVRALVTRLECTDWDNPGLSSARAVLADLEVLVDQLLDQEQARRDAAIWRTA